MKFNRILVLCIAMLACLNAPILMGQTGGGAVVGTVHDPSGAVIPKAQVVLTNTETGVLLTTQSTSAGVYTFPVVPAGTYSLNVTAAGFNKTVQTGILVPFGKTVTSDVALEVGTVATNVQVKALSNQLDTQTAQAATTIDQQTYDDLPIALTGQARSVTAVADLMPGVADSPSLGGGFGQTGSTGQQFSTTISGGQSWGGEVFYDGLPMVSSNLSGDFRQQAVPVEALSEFSLVQNNFAPEYSRTPGGVLTYSTRAGTNAFHGQAYEYLRNNDLDAGNYFGGRPTPLKQNEFGVNIGGPIIIPHLFNGRDKLHFFAFYSGFRLAAGIQGGLVTVPTQAERTGDFTAIANKIYDPLSCTPGQPCTTRTQFSYNGVANVIPPDRLQPIWTTWINALPLPTSSALTNNFISNKGVDNAVQNRWGGRVDYAISEKDHLNGFFSTGHDVTANYSELFANPLNTYGSSTGPNQLALVRIGEDHSFSPTLLLHLEFGYNRDTQNGTPNNNNIITDYGIANGIGVTPQIYCNPANCPAFPTTNGSGGSLNAEHDFSYGGFLSWTRGRHQFKLGGEFDKNGYNAKNNSSQIDTIDPRSTGFPSVANSGDPFASLAIGAFDAVNMSVSPFGADARFMYAAAYFNDDYKVTDKLVVNLGLRYEVPWTQHVLSDVFSTFSPLAPNPGAGGRPGALVFQGHGQYGCQCNRLASTRYIYWQPRIGVAYKIDDKTVVHAGFGIFEGANAATYGIGINADGYNASPAFTSTDGLTPAVYAADGYPSFTPPPFISPTYDNGHTISWLQKQGGRVSTINNYTLDIQRQLPHNFLMDISYVGNSAQHLSAELQRPQQIPIGYTQIYGDDALRAPLSSPTGQATGVPLPFPGFTGTVATALSTYPQYTGFNMINENDGKSNYNALEGRLQRQFTNGFSILASYTWGRTFTNAEDMASAFNDGAQDAFNPQGEYGPSYNQPPNTFVVSYDYELPFGYNRRYLNHGLMATLVGGWGVSGIQHYQSGNPYWELGTTNTLPINNSNHYRPNFVPGQPQRASFTGKFNPYTDFWLNSKAFTSPPPDTFGNTPKNLAVRGPAYYDEALSARKNFHIYESMNFQFRADFFNAFNRVNFGSANCQCNNPDSNPGFGQLNSQTNSPRSIQFAGKFLF